MSAPYFPHTLFAPSNTQEVRGLVAPHRYIQGPGAIARLGSALHVMQVGRAGLLITEGGRKRLGEKLDETLSAAEIETVPTVFDGECSLEQIERSVRDLTNDKEPIDCLIGVGGGKCLDAAKAIAHRVGVCVAVVPSLASTDAPCSAVSVLYTPEGAMSGAEFFPENPALVLMDTELLVSAPPRYLVAGMGDALATWYEARVCQDNSKASSVLGCRPTLAASSIGALCSQTIYDRGEEAFDAARTGVLNSGFEDVVEANTLHSGMGFESGGLAAAHAVASGLTFIPRVDEAAMHGEMVALGILTQLVLEDNEEELERARAFFLKVGLPVHFGQVELNLESDEADAQVFVAATCGYPTMANMPLSVTDDVLLAAIRKVDALGRAAVKSSGDAAWRSLR